MRMLIILEPCWHYACYWEYSACIKISTPPVGTWFEYQYGDDFKGNIDIMALTLCPSEPKFYNFVKDPGTPANFVGHIT